MHPKAVNSTYPSVEIHPYVQARLRGLSRRDEPAGLLLGTSDAGLIQITGFKRVPANALRHTAESVGSTVVGFYRLFTPQAPMLSAEEEDLLANATPYARAVFLLVHTSGGIAHEAIAWIREPTGIITTESVPLNAGPTPVVDAPALLPPPLSSPRWLSWAVALLTAALISAGLYAIRNMPRQSSAPPSPPTLALDLRSRGEELTAAWQLGSSPTRPQSAYLIVREGKREQVTDLTASFTSQGRVVIHPNAEDVIVTLQLNFPDSPPISRSATYLGFTPPPPVKPTEPEPATHPDAEIDALRRRNKELEEANAALRRHFRR